MAPRDPLSFSRPLTDPWPAKPERLRAGGSLTEGAPPTELGVGVWDFRMPILVLGLEPVVDAAAFPSALQHALGNVLDPLSAVIVRAAGISVSAPFVQRVPSDSIRAMIMEAAGFMGSATAAHLAVVGTTTNAEFASALAFMGGPHGAAILIGVPLAALVGLAIGEVARDVTGRNQISARWITVAGTLQSDLYPFATAEIERAFARATASVIRFQHPARPGEFATTDGASILARLSAANACTGGRRYDKVYAAACLRFARSAMAPVSFGPQVTAAPGATRAPALSTPAPAVVVPDPEPPTAWEGPGPRPTIPPEHLQPATTSLASRARRYVVPTVLAVTAAATAGLLWSLVRSSRTEKGEATEALRANPGRDGTEVATVTWDRSMEGRLTLRRLVQERAPARYVVLAHPSSAEAKALRRMGAVGEAWSAQQKAFGVDAGRLPGLVESLLETGSARDRDLAVGILQGLHIRLA
jgi:hypothetical protein